MYKPMRPSQILKSEKLVTEAIRVIEDDFINPFGLGYDDLHNISSGTSVETELASCILQVHNNGVKQAKEFVQSRIYGPVKFHDPLKKTRQKRFKDTMKSHDIKSKKASPTTVEVNRNIIGLLLSCSLEYEY